MLKHIAYTQNNKLKWICKHIPFCVGVCSNIPGYQKAFVYINDDMDMMVGKMIAYLKEMSIKLKMVLCGEDLLNSDLNSHHYSHANVETNMSHIIGVYYDLQSECMIYNPTYITNFGLFGKEKKMYIVK